MSTKQIAILVAASTVILNFALTALGVTTTITCKVANGAASAISAF